MRTGLAKRGVFARHGGIAGLVYGTIVVLAALTAGAKGFQNDPWRLAALVVTTVIVLWIAHVYSHALGESLEVGRHLTRAELSSVTLRELSIPLAAVAPTAVLLLGTVGVFSDKTAVWLSIGIGVATLGAAGARYAQVEHLGRVGTITAVALNLLLGLAIVALKVVVAH